jgi:hypothetical protein
MSTKEIVALNRGIVISNNNEKLSVGIKNVVRSGLIES